MKIWKIVIAVILIFGTGVVTGGLLVKTRVPKARPAAGGPFLGGPAGIWGPNRPAFIQRLDRNVELTPEQRAEVERILQESHSRMQKVWDPIAPQALEETRHVRQQINALLTAEQRSKFNKMLRPHRQRPARERERTETTNSSRMDAAPR